MAQDAIERFGHIEIDSTPRTNEVVWSIVDSLLPASNPSSPPNTFHALLSEYTKRNNTLEHSILPTSFVTAGSTQSSPHPSPSGASPPSDRLTLTDNSSPQHTAIQMTPSRAGRDETGENQKMQTGDAGGAEQHETAVTTRAFGRRRNLRRDTGLLLWVFQCLIPAIFSFCIACCMLCLRAVWPSIMPQACSPMRLILFKLLLCRYGNVPLCKLSKQYLN